MNRNRAQPALGTIFDYKLIRYLDISEKKCTFAAKIVDEYV